MKNIASAAFYRCRRHTARRAGFTLLEILLVVAAVSSVAAVGYFNMSGGTVTVREAKLRQDIQALNSAVRAYRMSGGDLESAATGDAVIAKLKTVSSSRQRSTIAGLRGSVIDPRLRGMAAPSSGGLRAVWNSGNQTFEISSTGTGFSEFLLDGPAAAPVQEDRRVLMALDAKDNWVWSFDEGAHSASGPRTHGTVTETPITPPTTGGVMTVLQAPTYSAPSGLYSYDSFNPDMKVRLNNPNGNSTSEIFYSVNNGDWVRWNGSPLSIPRELSTTVRAYAAPLDPDKYETSAVNNAQYKTIFFTGTSSGLFTGPAGDAGLDSNLKKSGTSSAEFYYGTASVKGQPQNSLKINSLAFSNIAPGQQFELARLTYYNGTTASGSNATTVKLNFELNFTNLEKPVTEKLTYTFKLLSTTNLGLSADADADYVWIPEVASKFSTVIEGQTFYLELSFGNAGNNGFTTIDTFHTHEGKSMTGTIYGRFVNTTGGTLTSTK